jgi:hypothetical protein
MYNGETEEGSNLFWTDLLSSHTNGGAEIEDV